MEVIPAIDIKDGACVRLYQGDFAQETIYSSDPVSVARQWEEMGASRIHLVDLNGAANGDLANLNCIKLIVAQSKASIQVGGGIRSTEAAERMLDTGVARIIIGTSAIENPSMVEQLCIKRGPGSVIVAVDAKDGLVAIRGWQQTTSIPALDLGTQMADLGVKRLLYTDISRDGTLSEPNFNATKLLVQQTGLHIVASGGVASLSHITQLIETGVEGVVVGRAIYTGDLNLREAITISHNNIQGTTD